MERFTTDSVTSSHRISYWNDVISQTFTGLDVSCVQGNSYSAGLSRTALGELTLANPYSSAARLQHTERHIRGANGRCLLLHGQLSGSSIFVQGDREASLKPGDFLIGDDASRYEFNLSDDNRMFVVRIPEQSLGAARIIIDSARGIVLPRNAAETKLLHGYLSTLWNNILANGQTIVPVRTGNILIDLVEMACTPFAQAGGRKTIGAGRRNAMREFVHTHLVESDLTVGRIAVSLGVTSRYVQRLFAEMDTTPSHYVSSQRLRLAAQLLSDPSQGCRPVSEIAYAIGFNDLSHFGRQFKTRFGVTPKLYRKRALSG
jgi:AraC-like DNA-binding protein